MLIDKLQRVATGEIKRLMVFMPPGSAKSTYCSMLFPAWYMACNPGKHVIAASHTQELADRFGRKVRGHIRDERYRELFDAELSGDSQAASRFALSNGCEYYGVGVGGAVTGFRADLGVIDDPVKSQADADSETYRARAIEWYKSDFWTRLKPGASVVLIMTRWHEGDLAGHLLEEAKHGGEQWEVLRLPMIAEDADPLGRSPGDMLWPEWFTPEMVAEAKRNTRTWAALYQQRPTPDEGGIFKAAWFKRFDTKPDPATMIVQSWDMAYKPAQHNDPSVCTTWAIAPSGYFLLDIYRARMEYPELKRAVYSLADKWKPGAILVEDKASGQSVLQEVGRDAGMNLIAIEPENDKATRARVASAPCEAGRVFLPNRADWLADFERELLTFPNDVHDDQVDSLSQFLIWAEQRGHGRDLTKLWQECYG